MKFRLALAVAVGALVPLVPAAAQADRYTHADASGDVYSTVGATGTFAPAPDRAVGDVISSTVKHKKRTVILQLAYRDLVNDAEYDAHVFFVRTSKMTRTVRLVASSADPGGRAIMYKGKKKVSCHVRRHIDYTFNTATVVIPRSCLGKPRWVKAAMGGVMFTGGTATDTTWIDDALSTGTDGTAVFGPRVFR